MFNPDSWWPSPYGETDEHGSLNEITPAKVVQATQLVREGRVFDLGRTLDANVPHFASRYFQQTLVSASHIINPRQAGNGAMGLGCNNVNWITEQVSGTFQIGTQLDGLNHLQIGDRCYNGWRLEDIVEDWGTNRLGIETVPPVITRGILVDIARYRGMERLDAGDVIGVEDVEGALRAQGISSAGPGDIVLFHTGWGSLWDGDHDLFSSGEPGAGMAVAEWLVDHHVAVTGADTWSFGPIPAEDPDRPFLVPQTLNVKHGLFIMENVATEGLAEARVYEFMFVLTHHKTRGSTAAVIAPAAVC
jgi:kynurenine formamidase